MVAAQNPNSLKFTDAEIVQSFESGALRLQTPARVRQLATKLGVYEDPGKLSKSDTADRARRMNVLKKDDTPDTPDTIAARIQSGSLTLDDSAQDTQLVSSQALDHQQRAEDRMAHQSQVLAGMFRRKFYGAYRGFDSLPFMSPPLLHEMQVSLPRIKVRQQAESLLLKLGLRTPKPQVTSSDLFAAAAEFPKDHVSTPAKLLAWYILAKYEKVARDEDTADVPVTTYELKGITTSGEMATIPLDLRLLTMPPPAPFTSLLIKLQGGVAPSTSGLNASRFNASRLDRADQAVVDADARMEDNAVGSGPAESDVASAVDTEAGRAGEAGAEAEDEADRASKRARLE